MTNPVPSYRATDQTDQYGSKALHAGITAHQKGGVAAQTCKAPDSFRLPVDNKTVVDPSHTAWVFHSFRSLEAFVQPHGLTIKENNFGLELGTLGRRRCRSPRVRVAGFGQRWLWAIELLM